MSKRANIPLNEFLKQFGTEESCRDYLLEQRWPEGFICPKCGHKHGYRCLMACTSVPTAAIRSPSQLGPFCTIAMSA